MPRSPRATITQSAARTISSARSTACGFSILAISGSRVCSRTRLDVLGAAHERQRDEVDADLLAGAQVLEVLLGHGRQRGGLARDVEALARGDGAADLDHGVDLAVAGARVACTRRRTAPSARYMISSGPTASASPAQEMYMRVRVAVARRRSPQTNVTRVARA